MRVYLCPSGPVSVGVAYESRASLERHAGRGIDA